MNKYIAELMRFNNTFLLLKQGFVAFVRALIVDYSVVGC